MLSTRFVCATRAYATFEEPVPTPYLRRSFTVEKEVVRAGMTVCAAGFYEFYLNGARRTRGLLTPYISNPDDILYYDRYDLAPFLRPGENVLGFLLGNGMMNAPGGAIWDFDLARFRGAPRLAVWVEIEYADGGKTSFEADERFLCHESPIRFDDLRAGEWYDARRELPGWSEPEFDASAWSPALPAEAPRGEQREAESEPIVVREERPAVSVRRGSMGYEPHFRPNLPVFPLAGAEGEREGWLYDFGLNDAGLCRLKIRGEAGQKIVLQFAEALDEQGRLDLRTMTFLPAKYNQRDVYVCKGGGEEVYTPSFTYHGFRYCLVLGMKEEQAVPEALTYLVMSSDLPSCGSFSCSDATLNALQEMTRRSDLSNFYHFPTDCPQREKNGWTADAALSAEQLLLNFRAERSYREWLRNIRKAQREDGALPGIIPTGGWGFHWGNGPAWDAVLFTLPYTVWKYRGDREIIRENAAAMMRYLHYITTRRDADGLIHIGLGDWCHAALGEKIKAPLKVTDTFMCMDICHKAEVMLRAIGMELQAEFAASLGRSFRSAARECLLDRATLTVCGSCQASQAMGLYYGIFEPGEEDAAFRVLLRLIAEQEERMDVGVLGARVLFRVLAARGQAELAWRMITTERYPSYGYWVKAGATTLWEGFWPWQGSPMSENHHFWGDVSGWMYETLGGVRVDPREKGLGEVWIEPRFVPQINHADARTVTALGEVAVSWRREGCEIALEVRAPEGAAGHIRADLGWQFADGGREKELASGAYRLVRFDVPCAAFRPVDQFFPFA